MNTLCRILTASALAAALGSAQASETYSLEIYGNNFSNTSAGAMAGWSASAPGLNFSTPPSSTAGIGQFLGEFGGTQSASFTLTDPRLRAATVTMSLDFLAIRSWDGNDPQWGGWNQETLSAGGGSDRFMITANDATLLDKSFSNGAGTQTYTTDALPPNGINDFPMAGSRERYTLGYAFYDGINIANYDPQDAIYGMIFSFAVGNTDTLTLGFAGAGLQDTWIENDPRCSELAVQYCRYRDESWGLDNFLLTLETSTLIPGAAIPLPGTLAILTAGMIGFLGVTRRRAKR
jgi:hypothetical protein